MAYNSKGKTYTDHPLMDEICYACKAIFKSIVVKNDVLANDCETANSVLYGEMYRIITESGSIPFEVFPFTYDILLGYGYSPDEAATYAEDKTRIPESDRDSVTAYANQYFIDHFEEENNYYRSLMGLPPFDTGETCYVYLTESDIPDDYQEPVDLTIPLHEQPIELIQVLYYEEVIDRLREVHKGSKYAYILHMGPRAIDLYTARIAAKWDILYMANVQYQIEDRFLELYKINREMYETRTYQEFYAQAGEYYDQMMILMLLSQTFADLVNDVPEWYIRRDIFDLRSCQYFLDASGVDYYNIIPLRYQIRLVKNLNRLIKYKSSTQNLDDILDVFDIPDTHVNRYWIYKKLNPENGNLELDFIASDVHESYDDYMKDNIFRTPYDDITLQDKYWDGEQKHSTIKNLILEKPFTIQSTKYMSLEYDVSLEKLQYQMGYALGLMLDNKVYDGLKQYQIPVPTISEFTTFSIPDLFLAIELLSISFYTNDPNVTIIRKPFMYETEPPKIKNECKWILDWKVHTFPDIYVNKYGRVLGFNNTLDKEALIDVLKKRHGYKGTRFGRNDTDFYGVSQTDPEYQATRANNWITDIGVYDFIIPDDTITDLDRYKEVYETNTKIYDHLKEMIENADNQDDKKYLEYAMQEMFTKPYDKYVKTEGGLLVDYTDLADVLKDRDYVLYKTYKDIMAEPNLEARQELMRGVLNDIIDTLDYYLSGEGFDYLYSFTGTESFEAIIKYMYLVVTFFKSFKVYFLDPYYSLHADDKMENFSNGIDAIKEWNERYWKVDKQFADDTISGLNEELFFEEHDPENTVSKLDIFAHFEYDPFMDFDINGAGADDNPDAEDIDGGNADETLTAPYIMLNGGYAYQGMVDFNDFNGGDAYEAYEEYYEVDGGYAYHDSDWFTDAMGSQMFNYMIDGGCAHGRHFMNNNVTIDLVGKEFEMNVVVSPRDDLIEINSDGLYVSTYSFADGSELDVMKDEVEELDHLMTVDSVHIEDIIRMLTDTDYRLSIYNHEIDKIVGNMEYVVDQMTDNKFKNRLVQYVDAAAEEIPELAEDYLNPYGWTDL